MPRDVVPVLVKVLPVEHPVTARNEGLIAVSMDLVPTHLAVRAVSVMTSLATFVPALRGRTTSETTEIDGLVPMLAPAVMANLTVMPVPVPRDVMVVPRAPKTDDLVRRVTAPTVHPMAGAHREPRATSEHLDARVHRVRADDLLLAPPAVTRVMHVRPVPTRTGDPVPRRAAPEVDRVSGRAIHRVGGERHGPPANSPRKK